MKKYILGKRYDEPDGSMYIGGSEQQSTFHPDPKLGLMFSAIKAALFFRRRLSRRREDNMTEYTVHEVDGGKVTDLRR